MEYKVNYVNGKLHGLQERYYNNGQSWFKVNYVHGNKYCLFEYYDFDGKLYFTFENSGRGWEEWPFDKKQHILLNLAVGGNWGGQKGVDDSIFPNKFLIDYVRVYGLNP